MARARCSSCWPGARCADSRAGHRGARAAVRPAQVDGFDDCRSPQGAECRRGGDDRCQRSGKAGLEDQERGQLQRLHPRRAQRGQRRHCAERQRQRRERQRSRQCAPRQPVQRMSGVERHRRDLAGPHPGRRRLADDEAHQQRQEQCGGHGVHRDAPLAPHGYFLYGPEGQPGEEGVDQQVDEAVHDPLGDDVSAMRCVHLAPG
jgi:hypothetical protein